MGLGNLWIELDPVGGYLGGHLHRLLFFSSGLSVCMGVFRLGRDAKIRSRSFLFFFVSAGLGWT